MKAIIEDIGIKVEKVADFIMKYRYIIAAIILLLLVIFKINFSSINMWTIHMNETEINNVLLGEARPIRSDEWLTQSSFMLGETQGEDAYKLYNRNIAQGTSNMFMLSAPVADILTITRPLLWGFIFGRDFGFSFYWSLRMIAIIMVSVELVKKICKNNVLILAGGFALAFAPAMMWWFSTSVVDGYIYGLAVVILFGYYMKNLNWQIWKKLLIALGITITLPGFIFSLYPAFQVPFGFFMAVFMLVDFIKAFKKLKIKDYLIIFGTLILCAAFVLRFLFVSWGDIQTMMSTVYPGHREELGGNLNVDSFIVYLVNLFFPYTSKIPNTCEPSTHIYSLTALIILLIAYFKNIKENKKQKDFGLITLLTILYLFFFIWEFIGFNKILSKITFMYFSPAQRTHVILGIIGVILSIIMVQKAEKGKFFSGLQGALITFVVLIFTYVIVKNSGYASFFNPLKYTIVFTVLGALTYFLVMGRTKLWAATIIGVAIISGCTVNPIAAGIAPVTDTTIAKEIREIAAKDKEALWIGNSNVSGQYLISNGVNTLNGVNNYPNFGWIKIVDPERVYDEVYNRFAHISITLSDETSFELTAQDSYTAYLTYQNLKDLGVKYYFSNTEVLNETIEKFKLNRIYSNEEKQQYIYEIQ